MMSTNYKFDSQQIKYMKQKIFGKTQTTKRDSKIITKSEWTYKRLT